MPRFTKSCHNPRHDRWICEEKDEDKIICLRGNGLAEVVSIYRSFETEDGGRRPNISKSCSQCLLKCCRKEVLGDELAHCVSTAFIDKIYSTLSKYGFKPEDEMEWESSYTDTESQTSSQNSASTIFTSSSQIVPPPLPDIFQAETTEKSCQTEATVTISQELYDDLVSKSSAAFDLKEEILRVRQRCTDLFGDEGNPEMDPKKFEIICQEAGANKIFPFIFNAICVERMSESRCELNKIRAMVVIYMMVFGQSQKANWFQVALSRTLSQYGISDYGLASLRNLGIAAHPRTVKSASLSSSANHQEAVKNFFEESVKHEHFIVFFIDDYHNIHTKHRPSEMKQTQATHMSTLLVKVFKNIKAIPIEGNSSALSQHPADASLLKEMVEECMSHLSKSYAQDMPDWITAKYFDPAAERQRLLVYDYQQTELKKMRSMDDTKLVDCLEMPLKSFQDLLAAVKYMLENGLSLYLAKFFLPFVGDWPTQFYMRQLVYSDSFFFSGQSNIIPFIGPLHISLNSRETVVLKFHSVFKELYSFLFGEKAFLAKKPKAWRQSLLLEVLYGGWSLVRDEIVSVFRNCKEVEYVTLINLLDTYCPLVLSLYSIEFKNNYSLHYIQSVLRCWVMLMVFKRRHYNKALLILLTTFSHLKKTNHPLFNILLNSLNIFDEYPVENFHSVLRSRTKPTDSGENIFLKAREIDACKHELHEFKSWFVPPRKYSFSPGKIKVLKVKAAKFLVQKFAILRNSPQEGKMIPRMSRQRKTVSKWKLPNIFQESVVTNQVLPLAYNNPACSPCSTKKCDKSGCSVVSSIWRIFQCGHSFHVECNLPAVSECHICKAQIIKLIEDLSAKANTAVFNRGTEDDETEEQDDDDPQEQEEQTQQSDVGDDLEFLDAGDVESLSRFALTQKEDVQRRLLLSKKTSNEHSSPTRCVGAVNSNQRPPSVKSGSHLKDDKKNRDSKGASKKK
eukprot:gene4178-4734_t